MDLTNGNVITLATIPGVGTICQGLELSNYTTAYITSQTANQVYMVDLTNGAMTLINSTAFPSGNAVGLTLRYTLPSLSGNNRSFANYLLNKTPYSTTSLFIRQPNIEAALYSAIPTRNAIGTYASQTTYMAMGQVIWDHIGQNRMNGSQIPLQQSQIADASSVIVLNEQPNSLYCSCPDYNSSIWLSGLGEYTREKSQQQTPAFHTATGGAIAAYEYEKSLSCPVSFTIGAAAGYAYTHVHEDDNAGHANVQQGSLFLYSSSIFDNNVYIDFAVAGGYYYIDNTRKISLAGIPSAKATSRHHGWQAAPHLEIGWDRVFECISTDFAIEPFAMADWVNCWEDSFREKGAGILNAGIKGRTGSLFRAESGLRFNETFYYCCGTLNLREKISYAYQKNLRAYR